MRVGTEYLTPNGWVVNPVGHLIGCLNKKTYSIEWNKCESISDTKLDTLYEIKAGKTLKYCCPSETQLLFYCKRTKVQPLSNLLYRWNNNSIVVHGKHVTAFGNDEQYDFAFRARFLSSIMLVLLYGIRTNSGSWLIRCDKLSQDEYNYLIRQLGATKSNDFLRFNVPGLTSIDDVFSLSSFQAKQLFHLITTHPSTEDHPTRWAVHGKHLDNVQIIAIYSGYTTVIDNGMLHAFKKSPYISLKRGVEVSPVVDQSFHPNDLSNYVTRYKTCVTSIHRG